MKKLIASFLIITSCLTVSAQTDTTEYYNPDKQVIAAKDRVSVSLTAGAGVSVFNSNTAFITYVAPKISYQINNKFRINMGFMHYTASGNTFMPISNSESISNFSNRPVSGDLVFLGGDYLLNEKIILSGSVMMDVNNVTNKQSNYKAATLGMEYKISKHSSIKFETTISEGRGNYNNNGSSFPTSSGLGGGFMNNDPMFGR
ncbi:MAG: hypothetical protein M3R27_10765 [Bacteroidota bacterium]|nr:hypothetical protein [Bacteroidota bacterium]